MNRSLTERSHRSPSRFSSEPQKIFAGLTIYCSQDLPQSDREIVYGAVQALGGQSRNVPTKDTTHIITSKADEVSSGASPLFRSLTALFRAGQSSLAQVKDSKLGIKFVLPLWFTNSASMARLLPTPPYEFRLDGPEPLVQTTDFRLASAQKREQMIMQIIPQEVDDSSEKRLARVAMYKAIADAHAAEMAADDEAGKHPVNDELEGKALPQILAGRKVMLCPDLGLSPTMQEMLVTWIKNAGGEPVEDVESCHILIGTYREGRPYQVVSGRQADPPWRGTLIHLCVPASGNAVGQDRC